MFTNWNDKVAPMLSVTRKSLEMVASTFQNGNPRIPKPPEPVSTPRSGRRNWLKIAHGFENMFTPVFPLVPTAVLPPGVAHVPAGVTLYWAEFPPVNGVNPAAPS